MYACGNSTTKVLLPVSLQVMRIANVASWNWLKYFGAINPTVKLQRRRTREQRSITKFDGREWLREQMQMGGGVVGEVVGEGGEGLVGMKRERWVPVSAGCMMALSLNPRVTSETPWSKRRCRRTPRLSLSLGLWWVSHPGVKSS